MGIAVGCVPRTGSFLGTPEIAHHAQHRHVTHSARALCVLPDGRIHRRIRSSRRRSRRAVSFESRARISFGEIACPIRQRLVHAELPAERVRLLTHWSATPRSNRETHRHFDRARNALRRHHLPADNCDPYHLGLPYNLSIASSFAAPTQQGGLGLEDGDFGCVGGYARRGVACICLGDPPHGERWKPLSRPQSDSLHHVLCDSRNTGSARVNPALAHSQIAVRARPETGHA